MIGAPLKECLFFSLLTVATALGQTKPGGLDPREIYRKVQASVVAIEAVDPAGKVEKSGSGFLVGSEGKILTNYHVIAHVKQATVRLANGDA
jgi:S1-C subfamily serine protease